MKCPKCGHENPNDQIFCEECDWKLTEKPKDEKGDKLVYIMTASVVLGLASVILVAATYLNKDGPNFGIWSVVLGGIGLLTASYSQTRARISQDYASARKMMVAITAVALFLSIIGFMFGLAIALK